ncbi:membrane protein insertase YidC [Candidatus Saccharibacteria bacterium]|nr:membrane protein insertase YidC [Candidatus Saccharibacteria bacterium]
MFRLIDFLIVRPITNVLFFIFNYVDDFGLAIIIFVILVKLFMWPLVKRQLYQTKLMRHLQPELAEIKKNCNGNRQLESLQTMDLYKKYNVKPFRSLLSLLIQLPMMIAIFGAIRVMVTVPTPSSNLDLRAYSFVKSDGSNIKTVVDAQSKYLEEKSAYDEALSSESLSEEEKSALSAPVYEFHPRLFGSINLEEKPGLRSLSGVIALVLTVASCLIQFFVSKGQRPSGKSKSKSFRQLMKEAGEGKELDQAEINDMSAAQMSYMMPLMLLFIMLSLPGALILYYFLSSAISLAQQQFILKRAESDMEISADKSVLKELKALNKLQEAEVIENKKTGQKITKISAGNKKKRR